MTPPTTHVPQPDPSTMHLPRILCLHGGGTNSNIFKIQLRSFLGHAQLKDRYRFVFVNAPFDCEAGAGVSPFFDDQAPFYRWSRWLKTHPDVDARICHRKVMTSVRDTMRADDSLGATGEWVGLVGFSQGAKVACSLLYRQQLMSSNYDGVEQQWKNSNAPDDGEDDLATFTTAFRFGVIMAGRAPLLALNDDMEAMSWMQKASGLPDEADMDSMDENPHMRLSLPTLHVHGLKDEGLILHRRCVESYCSPGTAEIVEWEGGHRLAVKKSDVQSIVDKWIEIANEYGG